VQALVRRGGPLRSTAAKLIRVKRHKFPEGTVYLTLRPDGSVTIKTANRRDSNASQEILSGLIERR
jgi:hypothetical protein